MATEKKWKMEDYSIMCEAHYWLYNAIQVNNKIFSRPMVQNNQIFVDRAIEMTQELQDRLYEHPEIHTKNLCEFRDGSYVLTFAGQWVVDQINEIMAKNYPHWKEVGPGQVDVRKEIFEDNNRINRWHNHFILAWYGNQYLLSPYLPVFGRGRYAMEQNFPLMAISKHDLEVSIRNQQIPEGTDMTDIMTYLLMAHDTQGQNEYLKVRYDVPLMKVYTQPDQPDELCTSVDKKGDRYPRTSSINVQVTESVYDMLGLNRYAKYMPKEKYIEFERNMTRVLQPQQDEFNRVMLSDTENNNFQNNLDKILMMKVMEKQRQRVKRGLDALDMILNEGKRIENIQLGYNNKFREGASSNTQYWVELNDGDKICFLDLYGNMGTRTDILKDINVQNPNFQQFIRQSCKDKNLMEVCKWMNGPNIKPMVEASYDSFGSITSQGARIIKGSSVSQKNARNRGMKKKVEAIHEMDDDTGFVKRQVLKWFFGKDVPIAKYEKDPKTGRLHMVQPDKNMGLVGTLGNKRTSDGVSLLLGYDNNGEDILIQFNEKKNAVRTDTVDKLTEQYKAEAGNTSDLGTSWCMRDDFITKSVISAKQNLRANIDLDGLWNQFEEFKERGILDEVKLKNSELPENQFEQSAYLEIQHLRAEYWKEFKNGKTLDEVKDILEQYLEENIGSHDSYFLRDERGIALFREEQLSKEERQQNRLRGVEEDRHIANPDRGTVKFNPVKTYMYSTEYGETNARRRFAMMEALRMCIYRKSLDPENLICEDPNLMDSLAMFDTSTGKPIDEIENDFQKRVCEKVRDYLENKTILEDVVIRMDDQGIIQYSGKWPNAKAEDRRFVGMIGQIFPMDEYGMIHTQYKYQENYRLAGAYRADVKPGKDNALNNRTNFVSMEDQIMETVYRTLRKDVNGRANAINLESATAVNRPMSHIEGDRYKDADMEPIMEGRQALEDLKNSDLYTSDEKKALMKLCQDPYKRIFLERAMKEDDKESYLASHLNETDPSLKTVMSCLRKERLDDTYKFIVKIKQMHFVERKIHFSQSRVVYNALYHGIEDQITHDRQQDDYLYGSPANLYGVDSLAIVSKEDSVGLDKRAINAGVKKQGSSRYLNQGTAIINGKMITLDDSFDKVGRLNRIFFTNMKGHKVSRDMSDGYQDAVLLTEMPVKVYSKEKGKYLDLNQTNNGSVLRSQKYDSIVMANGEEIPTPKGFIVCSSLFGYEHVKDGQLVAVKRNETEPVRAVHEKAYTNEIVNDPMFIRDKDDVGRRFMSIKNTNSGLMTIESQVANVNVGGWAFDDGLVITQGFADRIKKERELMLGESLPADSKDFGIVRIGQKLIDGSGNKGVVNAIVDPNWTEEEAKKRDMLKMWQLVKANPQLDIITSMHSIVSRSNIGTPLAGMMDKQDTLKLLDGSEVPCGIYYQTEIISDKTADDKTKTYVEDGRKIGAQGIWAFIANGCDETVKYLFEDNVDVLVNYKEKLRFLGMDLKESNNGLRMSLGVNMDNRYRLPAALDPSKIDEYTVYSNSKYKRPKLDIRRLSVEMTSALEKHGGWMPLPFPLDFPMKKEAAKDPENDLQAFQTPNDPLVDGQYLLPVLAPEHRHGFKSDDEMTSVHDYTRCYTKIYENAAQYIYFQERMKEAQTEDERTALQRSMDQAQENAQRAYDEAAGKIIKNDFEGKDNMCRDKLMSVYVDHSATAIWTADPRLDLDTIVIGRDMCKDLGIDPNDPDPRLLMWRDPVISNHGMSYMKVKISDDPNIVGVCVNPIIAKAFNGDFDGDTVGLWNPQNENVKKELTEHFDISRNLLDISQNRLGQPGNELAVSTELDFQTGLMLDEAEGGTLNKRLDKVRDILNDCEMRLMSLRRQEPSMKVEQERQEIYKKQKECMHDIKDIADQAFDKAFALQALSMESVESMIRGIHEYSVKTGAKGNEKKLEAVANYAGYDAVQDENGVYHCTETTRDLQDEEYEQCAFANYFKAAYTGTVGTCQQKLARTAQSLAFVYALESVKNHFQAVQQMKKADRSMCDKVAGIFQVRTEVLKGKTVRYKETEDKEGGYWVVTDEPLTVRNYVQAMKKIDELAGIENNEVNHQRTGIMVAMAYGQKYPENIEILKKIEMLQNSPEQSSEKRRQITKLQNQLLMGSIDENGKDNSSAVYDMAYTTHNPLKELLRLGYENRPLFASPTGIPYGNQPSVVEKVAKSLHFECGDYSKLLNPDKSIKERQMNFGKENALIPGQSVQGQGRVEVQFAHSLKMTDEQKKQQEVYRQEYINQKELASQYGIDFAAEFDEEQLDPSEYIGISEEEFNELLASGEFSQEAEQDLTAEQVLSDDEWNAYFAQFENEGEDEYVGDDVGEEFNPYYTDPTKDNSYSGTKKRLEKSQWEINAVENPSNQDVHTIPANL